MLRRIWWFALGATAGAGASAWVAARAAKAREALTPANLGRTAVLSIADKLDNVGSRLRDPDRHYG